MSDRTKRIERRRAAMKSKGWVYASPGKPGMYLRAEKKPRKQIDNRKIRELLEKFCDDPILLEKLLASFSVEEND